MHYNGPTLNNQGAHMQYRVFSDKHQTENTIEVNRPFTSIQIKLGGVYLDLILTLNQCLEQTKDQDIGKSLRDRILSLLIRTHHLAGVQNVLNNNVENAQSIIEYSLKVATRNDAVPVLLTLLTLHSNQIENNLLQQSILIAEKNKSKNTYEILEKELAKRQSEDYDNATNFKTCNP